MCLVATAQMEGRKDNSDTIPDVKLRLRLEGPAMIEILASSLLFASLW